MLPPLVAMALPPHRVFSAGLDGACGAPLAKHFVRSGLREGGGGGGRARPPQRVRSVSLKGFDSAVRRASQPLLAHRVRSCSLRNGFWSLRPLLRQFTRSVARLASLEGVKEPFAQATGSRLLLVFARGSSVCVLARSRGESTSRRSIVVCSRRPGASSALSAPVVSRALCGVRPRRIGLDRRRSFRIIAAPGLKWSRRVF